MARASLMVSSMFDKCYLLLKAIHISHLMKKEKKKNTDQWVLTKQQQKEAKDFYNGKRINLLFHNFYTEKTGSFDPCYIPDDIYYNRINMYYNNHQLAKVVDNKCYYDILFPNFLQPEVIASRKGGIWFIGTKAISIENVLKAVENQKEIFVKCAVESAGGQGVKCIEIDENGGFRNALMELFKTWKCDIVIQSPLKQHVALSALNNNSVNTMRILTLLRNGKVKIYSAVIRIGGGKGRVDNFSSGGVSVGIDENGKLKKYGYSASGERVERHPVSGVEFEGYQLPAFEAAKEMVKKAHWYVPHFKLVSWDIATDMSGEPVLIETNLTNGELDFHQFCNGPLFGEDTKEILDEVFANS